MKTEVLEPLYQSSHSLFIGRSTELQYKQTLAAYSSSEYKLPHPLIHLVFFTNHTDVCLIPNAAQVVLIGLFIWPYRLSCASWRSAAKGDDFCYGTTDRRLTVPTASLPKRQYFLVHHFMQRIQGLADMSCLSAVYQAWLTLWNGSISCQWGYMQWLRHRHSLLKIQHFKVGRCNYSNILYWFATTAKNNVSI